MWSYFEDFFKRKIIVQPKFNLDVWFSSYRFFIFRFFYACEWCQRCLFCACMYELSFLLAGLMGLMNGPNHTPSGDGWWNHLRWWQIAPLGPVHFSQIVGHPTSRSWFHFYHFTSSEHTFALSASHSLLHSPSRTPTQAPGPRNPPLRTT